MVYIKSIGELPRSNIKENRPVILIWGASGFQNMGDEAMLSGNLETLRNLLGNKYDFIVLSFNPEKTYQLHKVTTKADFNRLIEDKTKGHNIISRLLLTLLITLKLLLNAKRIQKGKPSFFLDPAEEDFLRTLYNSEAILFVGGGYLNDIWLFGGLIARSIVLFLAKKMHKPVFLGAQTIGPLNKWWTRKIIKYFLKGADFITLRENSSEEFLKRIGVKNIPIKVVPDDAFNVSPISEKEALDILLKEGINISKIKENGKKVIAVNARTWWKMDNKNIALKDTIEKYINFIAEKNRYFIIFIPTAYGSSPIANDINSSREILESMREVNNIKLLKNLYTWNQIKGILQCVDISIGISYHFIVFSFSMGIPILGLYADDYYKFKIEGFFKLMGLENLAVDVRNLDDNKLLYILEKFLNEEEYIKEYITKKVESLKSNSCYAARQLAKFLRGEKND
jgi:N-acetylglucosaminyldiphosphoundecaprenol N-acetyl-beta-D-mannosaminyltransferase